MFLETDFQVPAVLNNSCPTSSVFFPLVSLILPWNCSIGPLMNWFSGELVLISLGKLYVIHYVLKEK